MVSARIFFAAISVVALANCAAVPERSAEDVYDRLMDMRDAGEVSDPEIYALTSADSTARYLVAYAAYGDHAGAAQELRQLIDQGIAKDGCIGWGLNAEWDAFADGSINPGDTIYAYTTAQVAHGLYAAFASGQEVPTNLVTGAECALVNIIGTATDAKGYFYPYSRNAGDLQPVTPVQSEVIAALLELAAIQGKLAAVDDAILSRLLAEQLQDGAFPYEPGGDVLPLYHAMVVRNLYQCAKLARRDDCRLAAEAGTKYLINRLMLSDGTPADQMNSSGWQHGEFRLALDHACESDMEEACRARDRLVAVIANASGTDDDNTQWLHNARMHSWAAAGLAASAS